MISAPDRRLNCCSSTERWKSNDKRHVRSKGKFESTYTSNNRNTSESQLRSELLRLGLNLLSQLTSRCKNKRIRSQMSVLIRERWQFRDERQPWKRRITKAQIEATKKIGNIVVFSVKHGKLKINGEKTPFAKKFAGLMKRYSIKYTSNVCA